VCDASHINKINAAILQAEKNLKVEGWRDTTHILEMFVFRVLKRK